MGMWWNLIMVLIYMVLMTNYVEYFFSHAYQSFVYLLL